MTAGTIPALLAEAVEHHGDRVAIVDGDVTLTYAQLQQEARRFGNALAGAGVEHDDRVAMWAPNSVEWIVAVLGLWEAGAVLVPINTRFKAPEAGDILRRSGAKAIVTVREFLGTDYVAVLDDLDLPDLETTIVDVGAFVADAGAAELPTVTADDRSDILFTSGTTGVPKGVVMTHGRTRQVGTDWVRMTGLTAGDRYLMVNPYFHMFGLKAGILASVAAGATMLPEPVFDAARVLNRIADEQVTVLPGAPTIYQSILDHPAREKYDLSSLRIAVTGAADIPVELIRRVRAELPFDVVLTGYGLTEGGTVSATAADDDPATIATTVGRARPGYEIRIVDGDTDAAAGETGEILVRSATVMAGYLDDPEATAQAIDADGWLRTGDLGVLDERRNLRIVGRSKDMFIVGGFNAYPAEIENALLRHPDVQQAAVIGIPDDRLGEVGMAFLVTHSGDPAAADEIRTWCRDQMANYKVPRAVEIVDELPINATGKVVKDDLRARVANR